MTVKIIIAAACAACLFSCGETLSAPPRTTAGEEGSVEGSVSVSIDAKAGASRTDGVLGAGVYPVESGGAARITLDNLRDETVFLLQLNAGENDAASPKGGPASSWHVAGVSGPPPEAAARAAAAFAPEADDAARVVRLEHPEARLFRGPPLVKRSRLARSAAALRSSDSYKVNTDTKSFWVQRAETKKWEEIGATLREKNDRCFVWVADANYDDASDKPNDNKITSAQATALADKFALVYEKETALFGFEYGGGPGGDGGADELSEVQILVYDIDEDFKADQSGGVIGFYWDKDERDQATLDEEMGDGAYKTNEAEIFYIDAHFTDRYPAVAYSTLIHEFQHMIHFNKKFNKHSAAWYNEMLSMLAEDVLCEYIDIAHTDGAHPIGARMPLFLAAYTDSGPAGWLRGNEIVSYSSAYAFGAYLARNFGGARLIKAMMDNALVDEASVEAAVSAADGKTWTFAALREKYQEALLFNGADAAHASFNRESAETVAGTAYTFKAFDIYALERPAYGVRAKGTGPYVFKPNETWTLAPGAAALVSAAAWQRVTGGMEINLAKSAAGVKSYIVIKK